MKICMIVPNSTVKGGIAAVVNGYREHNFGERYRITYVESYCDGSKMRKLLKALGSYFCFLKVIITNRPDLIHIHSSFGPSFYRKMPFIYLGKMFRIPIINHIHGAEFEGEDRNYHILVVGQADSSVFLNQIFEGAKSLSQDYSALVELKSPDSLAENISLQSLIDYGSFVNADGVVCP